MDALSLPRLEFAALPAKAPEPRSGFERAMEERARVGPSPS